jgi:hypothetical protein
MVGACWGTSQSRAVASCGQQAADRGRTRTSAKNMAIRDLDSNPNTIAASFRIALAWSPAPGACVSSALWNCLNHRELPEPERDTDNNGSGNGDHQSGFRAYLFRISMQRRCLGQTSSFSRLEM